MKANFLGIAAALALVSCCAVETAQASPIDVSYSVSGSPGEWLLDFTVTNNLDQFGGPGQLIYLFAVALPSTDISLSPPNWAYAQQNVEYASGPVYNNAWCINACIDNPRKPPGRSLYGTRLRSRNMRLLESQPYRHSILSRRSDSNCRRGVAGDDNRARHYGPAWLAQNMPSFSRKSPVSCTAAQPLTQLQANIAD